MVWFVTAIAAMSAIEGGIVALLVHLALGGELPKLRRERPAHLRYRKRGDAV